MKQEVFLDGNRVIGIDGQRRFSVELDEIEMMFDAWYEPYLDWPDHFSILILPETFFLIGPEVAYCVGIVDDIQAIRPDIPLQEIAFNDLTFPWTMRNRKNCPLRLLPTPGLGIFPRSKLPAYTMIEQDMSTLSRGHIWLQALSGQSIRKQTSVRIADGELGATPVRWLAVTPNLLSPFPRARNGETGLLEGWQLAHEIEEAIAQDHDQSQKRALIAIVDVPSQAYGRREEALGLHQSLAAAVDAYARARLAGHPVIALLVGNAMSGAFLAHGYQANRIIALRDDGVMVHAMGKAAAARITLRSVDELEQLAARIPPMAYDIDSYASLGLTWETLDITAINAPTAADIAHVKASLNRALADIAQHANPDLRSRLDAEHRQASRRVRELLRAQW